MRKSVFIGVAALLACAASHGASISLSGNASGWRLENYTPGGVVLWFTGSQCTNGQLVLPAGSTAADQNRLWATITTAKTTGRKMFVYYDNSNAPNACPLISFGLDAE
jgi:hypothetical protein